MATHDQQDTTRRPAQTIRRYKSEDAHPVRSAVKRRCKCHPQKWIRRKIDRIIAEDEKALSEKLLKAAVGCYQCGGASPTLQKVFPVSLKFSPPIVEQMFIEWRSEGDRIWEITALTLVVLIALYYWVTDWIDDEDPEHKPHRVWIRGSLLLMVISLSVLVKPRVGNAALWQQRFKLLGLSAILVLKFLRILFEVNTLLYVRSMAIWGILFRVLIIFGSGCYVGHFLVLNALNAGIDLTWHYAFRRFSDQHVFQWELVVFIFLQVHYFILKQKEREDFRRQILHCMERQVSNELAAVHEFVAHHSRDAIALHSVDNQGYHCFKFVSSAIEAMTGWSPDDLIGRRVTDFVHDKDKEIVENIFLKAYTYEASDADDFSKSHSYSERLQKIQQKFSKVLSDFDDHSIRVDTPTNSSAQIIPLELAKINFDLPASRTKRKKPHLHLAGELTWSRAVTSHELFAKLFSPSTRSLNDSFDLFYRRRMFAVDTETAITDQQSKESVTPPVPKSLREYSSPSVVTDESLTEAEDECVLGLGEESGKAERKNSGSALSSLPSLPDSELEVKEDFESSSGDESLSFRIISKSGEPVLVQVSCNNTPQGVVAVYRKLNPICSLDWTPP